MTGSRRLRTATNAVPSRDAARFAVTIMRNALSTPERSRARLATRSAGSPNWRRSPRSDPISVSRTSLPRRDALARCYSGTSLLRALAVASNKSSEDRTCAPSDSGLVSSPRTERHERADVLAYRDLTLSSTSLVAALADRVGMGSDVVRRVVLIPRPTSTVCRHVRLS